MSEQETAIVPKKWVDVLSEGGELKYQSPLEQYLKDARTWNLPDLAAVWEGQVPREEVEAVFARPFRIIEREMEQTKLREEAGLPDFTDPKYKERANASNILFVRGEIDYYRSLVDRIKRGEKKKQQVRTQNDDGKWVFTTIEVEYSAKEQQIFQSILDEKIKLHQLLTDQATEIRKVSHTVDDSFAAALARTMREMNHRDRDGFTITELQRAAQLPSAEPIDAEFEVHDGD